MSLKPKGKEEMPIFTIILIDLLENFDLPVLSSAGLEILIPELQKVILSLNIKAKFPMKYTLCS